MFTRARWQLTAAYAAVLALTIAALGGTAYAVARHQLDDEINRSLASALEQLPAGPLTSDTPAPTPVPRDDDDENHPGDEDEDDDDRDDGGSPVVSISPDIFVVTTGPAGSILENPRRVDLDGISFAALIQDYEAGIERQDISAGDGRFRLLAGRASDGSATYRFVGRSLTARDRQLRTLAFVFVAGGAGALLLSGAGAFWLAGRTLRPIRQSLETQHRFVSDASHELRTPLSVIKANNELLLRHPHQPIEANLDQVEAIAIETSHMTRLVDDLLTLARADEGRAELAREQLDLAALAASVARDMEPIASARGIALTTALSPAFVAGDARRLRQLVTILLDNAIKYTGTGGSITVRCAPAGRHHVELSVTDTGAGIAPADQQHVFDRFYRVEKSRARAEGGSGLGLAIARWVAEAHGGRITLRSRLGEGSTFTFRMPAAG